MKLPTNKGENLTIFSDIAPFGKWQCKQEAVNNCWLFTANRFNRQHPTYWNRSKHYQPS